MRSLALFLLPFSINASAAVVQFDGFFIDEDAFTITFESQTISKNRIAPNDQSSIRLAPGVLPVQEVPVTRTGTLTTLQPVVLTTNEVTLSLSGPFREPTFNGRDFIAVDIPANFGDLLGLPGTLETSLEWTVSGPSEAASGAGVVEAVLDDAKLANGLEVQIFVDSWPSANVRGFRIDYESDWQSLGEVSVDGIDTLALFRSGTSGIVFSGQRFGFESSIQGHAISVSAIPIPAAAWLLGSALAVLGWIRRCAFTQ